MPAFEPTWRQCFGHRCLSGDGGPLSDDSTGAASRAKDASALDALDDAACGLLVTDDKGLILQANTTFCAWLGYSAFALIGRRRLQDLLTMGGRIFHQTHWAPLLQMQGSVSEVKLDVRHNDGTVIPMVLNAIRRERGGIWLHNVAAFIARDRDKYEQELLLSRQKLELLVAEATQLQAQARDRALFAEQMVGIVSHDLRNPLSAIHLGVRVLMKKGASPDQMHVLDRIARSTDRATSLIRDLLDFTSARIGKGLSVVLKPVDLHAIVAQAVEDLSTAFPHRRLEHACFGEGMCLADGNRLAQVIGNLVANAIVYGASDSAVTVTSSNDAKGWRLSVHNFGPVIPEEVRASLFRPMVRGDTNGGTDRNVGLGLFIVAEIAKAHHGNVTVESTAEGGTVFELSASRENA